MTTRHGERPASARRQATPGAAAAAIACFLLFGCSATEPGAPSPAAGGASVVHADRWPELASPLAADPDLEARVDLLLARMTIEEKVGQIIQAEIGFVTPEEAGRYNLGSVLNGGGSFPGGDKYATRQDWLDLADAFHDASTDTSDGGVGIPVIWGVDAVHGHNNVVGATLFPHNIGLGATRNPDLIRRIGEVTALEVRATGIDWNFGPTVAVARDDRWGRTYESYAEHPEVATLYAPALIEGLQGAVGSDEFLDENHVVATAKHFLGDGGTFEGTDQGDTRSSEEALRDIHGAPYVAALGSGVQAVMASFSSWQGRKLHGHEGLLTDVLKGRMGFDGLVVGDWNGHGQLPSCSDESCADTIVAGLDLFMVPEEWKALHASTLRQARNGRIPMERLDDAVRRVLRVKARSGLLDRGRPSATAPAARRDLLGAPAHREVARQAVRESLVLLKNNGNLLPLSPRGRILVAGSAADDIGQQSGGWSLTWQGTGNVNADFPGATSIWEGIRQAVTAAGGTATLSPQGAFRERPDVAVVVFGETPYAEGQGDLTDLEYSLGDKSDLALLRRLQEGGIPVVSVFLSGRPLWVNAEINASDAFVAAWLPGSEGGGIADVLLRDRDGEIRHDFTGRLSFSWPRSPDQAVLNVGDPGYNPLFAYGHGLSYSEPGEDLARLDESRPTHAQQNGNAGRLGAAGEGFVLFAARTAPPWQLFVGDPVDWAVPLAGDGGATRESNALTVTATDRDRQGDARAVRWAGTGAAQIYLQAAETVDMSDESRDGLALSIDVLVESRPASPVEMRMDCVYPCGGAIDVTAILSSAPLHQWQTLQIGLRCFEEAGADMTRINTPFLLTTNGALRLQFSRIEVTSPIVAAGANRCP